MYNKQTWLDEIPDMTKPIYDASGKQKTDPQTGRPLFELVQSGTRITSSRLNTMEGGIEAAHTLVEQLAKELGGNFVVPIDGTMGLLCSAQGLKATLTAGIAYVNGRRYQVAAGEMTLNPTQGQYLYVDIDGAVKKTTSQATAKKGLTIFYVATDTSGVISTTDHRVNISMEEILKKIKDIDIKEAVTGGASGLMTGADAKFVRVDGETKTGAQTKADAVKEYVNSRLDIPQRTKITLQPGLQVIQADQDAPFALTGLTGRTLVNLLGRDGNCESIARWLLFQGSAATDNTNKTEGMNGIKLTVTSGSFATATAVNTINAKANKFYLAIVDAKNGNATNASFYSNGLTATKGINTTTDATQFVPLWRAYAPTADVVASVIIQTNSSATSQYAYFDAVRFYEITAAEYAALDSMTPQQVAAKYPYVDSVQPVRNPYAIRYGENLLPPFYEYESSAGITVSPWNFEKPYTAIQKANSTDGHYIRFQIPVAPNSNYTLTCDHDGYIAVTTGNGDNQVVPWTNAKEVTFNVGQNSVAYVFFGNYNSTTGVVGTFTFKNPMLNIGNTTKPFKPREDVILALQTDLYADPVTGANADQVFEKDGQYFKLKKWRKVVLDGNHPWTTYQNPTGSKTVRILSFSPNSSSSAAWLVKYDGKVSAQAPLQPDSCYIDNVNNILYVGVPNADSGWGDAYTPTADEIKAYFMGWRMYQAPDRTTPYTSGTKQWFNIYGPTTPAVPTVPINSYSEWTPYQLVYQLATPTVEPITSEGQLTLIEGNNQVEVGTGIVLRETVIPYTYGAGINNINDNSPDPKGNLTNKTNKILGVYVDRLRDFRWKMLSNIANANGGGVAQFVGVLDKSKSYSVTYLMLDTFPIASFVGSIAENEKALLADLNDIVQQGASSLSVVERSLSEALQALIQQNRRNVWGPM